MTLEEAIIHCEEVADRCAVTDGDRSCEDNHRQLAEWLKELKKLRAVDQKSGEWISVKDRLPEEDGDYLVCYEEGYREDYGFDKIGIAPFEVDCEGFGIWQEYFHPVSLGSLGTEWIDIPVTHWMPLPELPEEEI